MLLEIGLVLGLNVLTAASAVPEAGPARRTALPPVEIRTEALVKPEGPKWAPNRMKILHFNRKARWVVRLPSALLPRQSCLDRARNKLG